MTNEDLDFTPVTFGKYDGKTPEEIATYDPGYVVWAFENIERFCSQALYDDCLLEREELIGTEV